MKTKTVLLAGAAAAMLTAMSASAQQAVSPANAAIPEMPKQTTRTGKRVNRVIDIWLKNQPVYYVSTDDGGYEEGKKMAATKADYITYGMEHGPLDFRDLREFMRGLADPGQAMLAVFLVAWTGTKVAISSEVVAIVGLFTSVTGTLVGAFFRLQIGAAGAEHARRKGSGLDGLLLKKDELVAKFRQVTLSG